MTAEHHAWEFFNSFVSAACPCKLSSGQLRLSDGIGSKFHVCGSLSVSRGMLETSEFCEPMYFGVLLLVLSRLKLSFANNSRFHLRWQLLQRILLLETGCGQVISVHCILLRSSMNLMIYLPRFLCICFLLLLRWHCCRNISRIVKKVFVFLL